MFGSTVGRSELLTPNHVASIAENSSSEVFLGFLQQQFEEITAMKHSVLAEVALFIHRPYA